MDIKELTQQMHDFVRTKGWYEPDSLRPQTLRNLAISLNLEASEVLEHFQWDGNLDDPDGLSGELADVALYLLQIASLSEMGINRQDSRLIMNEIDLASTSIQQTEEAMQEMEFLSDLSLGDEPTPDLLKQ